MSEAFAPPAGFRLFGEPGTFMGVNGPVYVADRAEGEILMLPTGPQHATAEGFIGGGLVMVLLAASMGTALTAAADGVHCPALGIDTRFIGLARVGQVLIGSVEIERLTGSAAFANATLVADGRVVGKATGVFHVPPAASAAIAARKAAKSSGEAK